MNHFIKLHTLFHFIIIIAIISLMVLYLCCGFPVYSFLPSSGYLRSKYRNIIVLKLNCKWTVCGGLFPVLHYHYCCIIV